MLDRKWSQGKSQSQFLSKGQDKYMMHFSQDLVLLLLTCGYINFCPTHVDSTGGDSEKMEPTKMAPTNSTGLSL